MFKISLLITLGWGALAFGSEYAWAYSSLMVLCLAPAILGLRAPGGAPPARALLVSLGLILLAAAVQLAAPASIVAGQGADPAVDFSRLYALATMKTPPDPAAPARLSIAPERTMLGLGFLGTFGLLLAGCTKGISAFGATRLVKGIAIVGVIVAFVGLAQSTIRTETLYGFWRQPRVGVGFAPFVNENHFAGWMAMVLSLTVGSFAGSVSTALQNVGANWRDRVLWFSSQRGSVMILTAFAAGIMALSMVITFSRGGLVGLTAVMLIGAWWMLRRQSGVRRMAGGVAIAALVVAAMAWGGAGKTVDQFSGATENIGERKPIWMDTVRIIQDYPLTGTGLNTYGIAMLHYQTTPRTQAVIEAHNDYLQLAAEGGLLLGIPILLALFLLVREIWKRFKESNDDAETYWLRAGAVTGLLTIAGMEVFDFTLQMPGAAAMFVVLCAIAFHKPNHLKARA